MREKSLEKCNGRQVCNTEEDIVGSLSRRTVKGLKGQAIISLKEQNNYKPYRAKRL